jgi:hypothetical protein
MLALVKSFRFAEVGAALEETPALLAFRDERGRNWLHVCCATKPGRAKLRDCVKTAEVLLAKGLELDREAFREGAWKATPLWFGDRARRTLALAAFAPPRLGHCCGGRRVATCRSRHPGESRAPRRVGRGRDPLPRRGEDQSLTRPRADAIGRRLNHRDSRGMTALTMLKKNSDPAHFAMLFAPARADIATAKARRRLRSSRAEGARVPQAGRSAREGVR